MKLEEIKQIELRIRIDGLRSPTWTAQRETARLLHTLRASLRVSSAFANSSSSRKPKIASLPLTYFMAWLMMALQIMRISTTRRIGLL